MLEGEKQTINQKKMILAASEHAPIIIELMKDCMVQNPLVGKTQWDTIVNAITLDVQGNMLRKMVDYIDKIKKDGLHEIKQ